MILCKFIVLTYAASGVELIAKAVFYSALALNALSTLFSRKHFSYQESVDNERGNRHKFVEFGYG